MPGDIYFKLGWNDSFTLGEKNTFAVFKEILLNDYLYDINGSPRSDKLSDLIKEIDIGLWDIYLQWDIRAYENLKEQKKTALYISKILEGNTQQKVS